MAHLYIETNEAMSDADRAYLDWYIGEMITNCNYHWSREIDHYSEFAQFADTDVEKLLDVLLNNFRRHVSDDGLDASIKFSYTANLADLRDRSVRQLRLRSTLKMSDASAGFNPLATKRLHHAVNDRAAGEPRSSGF